MAESTAPSACPQLGQGDLDKTLQTLTFHRGLDSGAQPLRDRVVGERRGRWFRNLRSAGLEAVLRRSVEELCLPDQRGCAGLGAGERVAEAQGGQLEGTLEARKSIRLLWALGRLWGPEFIVPNVASYKQVMSDGSARTESPGRTSVLTRAAPARWTHFH